MLKIMNEEYFQEVVEFAQKVNSQLEPHMRLSNRLNYLDTYGYKLFEPEDLPCFDEVEEVIKYCRKMIENNKLDHVNRRCYPYQNDHYWEQFRSHLMRMNTVLNEHLTRRPNTICELYKDFAPYSFSIVLKRWDKGEYVYWMSGGLIFHGNHDGYGSGSYPTLSVTVEKTDGWSIHT
jgi:hypothetical protein